MTWQWGYVSTVVPDVTAAVEFFTTSLGLPELAEGDFTAIGARGTVLGLGANCLLAVTTPTDPKGPAARQLNDYRGGLCHVAIAAEGSVGGIEGSPSTSPVGTGVRLPREATAGLLVEALGDPDVHPSGKTGMICELDHVATVVDDLEAGATALQALSMSADPSHSGWIFGALHTRNAVLPSSWGYLELNQADRPEGPFGSLWARQGPSIVGLTLTVDSVADKVRELRDRGVSVTDPAPVTAQRTPDEPEFSLGDAAVISMSSAHGTRIFLFEPTTEAPSYRP